VNVHVKVNQLQIPAFTVSNTALAMAFGGGVDVKIARHFAVRGQADYLYTGHDFTDLIPNIAAHQNNVRASAGIVYSFGGAERVSTAAPRQSVPRASGAGTLIPSLGATVAIGSNPGAEITDEAPNGVAALAGLHPGDVINAVDGKPVKTPIELAAELANRPAGDKVKISFLIRGLWQKDTVLLLGNH
jgi:S1-C subfamily serine protease